MYNYLCAHGRFLVTKNIDIIQNNNYLLFKKKLLIYNLYYVPILVNIS
jgi:hypothetical protein